MAFFFKHWGGRKKKAAGRELAGEYYDGLPTPKRRRKLVTVKAEELTNMDKQNVQDKRVEGKEK